MVDSSSPGGYADSAIGTFLTWFVLVLTTTCICILALSPALVTAACDNVTNELMSMQMEASQDPKRKEESMEIGALIHYYERKSPVSVLNFTAASSAKLRLAMYLHSVGSRTLTCAAACVRVLSACMSCNVCAMLAFAALAGLQGPRALRNLLGQHQELGGRVRVAVLDAPAAELITAVAAHAQCRMYCGGCPGRSLREQRVSVLTATQANKNSNAVESDRQNEWQLHVLAWQGSS